MCLFRKCDETIIETKEYPALSERAAAIPGSTINARGEMAMKGLQRVLVTSIKCQTCGRIRIDQRTV